MSAPACTHFCVNGHLVQNTPHGVSEDNPISCPYCGATRMAVVFEWGDPMYPMCDAVPQEPLRFDNVMTLIPGAVDGNGSPIEAYCFAGVPVYDVSGLEFHESMPVGLN